ncbi:DNA/RNA non-specific endonuclease [Nocardiopsis sp. FIRDI 009]|uniref:DNA/RNA non-specific endonuclease n=1 Tax=Nocardiopsis sp. FIRDI 009 TaxID=714197 RepID=UPI001E4DD171|nr:DNA/RNA non-specific endonuclease [Nocardiopsis sp. FIRDI 009]
MPPADSPAAGAPLTIEEQTGMLTDADGKISPYSFPVPTPSPDHIETLASRLRTRGGAISDTGHDINTSWGDLTGCYHAPEAEELYSVLRPVATDGDTVSDGLDTAASALEDFAEELREIKSDWAALRAEAVAFRDRIDAKGDEWREAEGIKGFFGIGQSPDVEENQGYVDRGTALIERYAEAERDCANRINADVPGRTRFAAVPENGELGSDVFYHGYEQDLSELATEWGMGGATTDEHWWVDVGAAVGDYVVGAVEDLGAMVGAHSSEGWFAMSWDDAMVEQWESSAQSVASLVGMYDAESDDWGWAGWGTVGSAWKDAAHAVVPWTEWDERPGYVIGTAVLNIGVTAVGAVLSATGVGAAVGVPLMAWRGASIVSNMGGGRIPDVDVPDVEAPGIGVNVNLPRFAGGSRELLRIDLSGLDLGGVSPQRLADVKGAVERLVARFGGGGDGTGGTEAPGGSPSTPRNVADDGAETTSARDSRRSAADEDPTAQDLWDASTVETLHEMFPEARGIGERYEPHFGLRETDSPGGWEVSHTGHGDGPEPDNAKVLTRTGAEGGDTLDAARGTPGRTPDRLNVTGIGDRGHDGDHTPDRDGDVRDSRSANLRDRTPDVANSVDNDAPTKGDSPNDTRVNEASDTPTNAAPAGGSGSRSIGGSLSPGGGGGGDGTGTPLTHRPIDLGDSENREFIPGRGQRFGDGLDLAPNSRYEVIEADGVRRTEYITDGDGKIREIRANSDGWNANHPEFKSPRPDMTYVVDDRYTYRTDSLGRTESVEGTLVKGHNVRNGEEQGVVNAQGRTYFQQLNEQLRKEFEETEQRPPEPGEVPEYQDIQWNGGHLIGYAEFFGIGERLNQVPMRFDVNQNRTDTALSDIPEEARGGIDGSYRNVERSWRGIMRDKGEWHGFENSKFNDGTWEDALARNPENPRIDVKITNSYDPNLKPVVAPADYDLKAPHFVDEDGRIMIPAPPSKVEVEWWLNGVRMRVQEYSNLPPLV